MTSIIIVAYVVMTFKTIALSAAKDRSLAEARIQAGIVKAEVEISLDIARARAQELSAVKLTENPLCINRDQVNAMIRQVLVKNPQFIGVWTLWEPDAFDGKDFLYANTMAYGKTGRFFPYWNRGTGTITVEPIVDFETGDWYQVPKKTKQEYITDLYLYPVMGQETWMISVV
ncbi:MAG: cache domain-containing protein, partial [Bacteroidales bacterium]|nr:cache domain-containing protein [Bacteroidales bacterium]